MLLSTDQYLTGAEAHNQKADQVAEIILRLNRNILTVLTGLTEFRTALSVCIFLNVAWRSVMTVNSDRADRLTDHFKISRFLCRGTEACHLCQDCQATKK